MKIDANKGLQPDIYGQVHPVETSKLLRRKLEEFDNVVKERTQTEDDTNRGLYQALEKCPELLTKAFKLLFLRAVVFDIHEAVNVFEHYWNRRTEIFGPEKAFAPMTIDSIIPEDRAALERGWVRVVPGAADDLGRAIVYIDASLHDSSLYTRTSLCRVVFYTLHAVLESETAQKHGVILLIDCSKFRFSQWDYKLIAEIAASIVGVIPVRVASFNIIRPPTFASRCMIPLAKLFVSDRLKKRVICSSGSNKSVVRRYEKYGLTKDDLPTELGGDVELNHIKWLKERRCKGL
jgi:hypothetical protein